MNLGVLGPLFCIKKTYSCYRRRNDWQALRLNYGGMLFNYGAHYVDQLMHIANFPSLCDVHCHLWAAATRGDADDVVKVSAF
jgi:predicted dehydrogenase